MILKYFVPGYLFFYYFTERAGKKKKQRSYTYSEKHNSKLSLHSDINVLKLVVFPPLTPGGHLGLEPGCEDGDVADPGAAAHAPAIKEVGFQQ